MSFSPSNYNPTTPTISILSALVNSSAISEPIIALNISYNTFFDTVHGSVTFGAYYNSPSIIWEASAGSTQWAIHILTYTIDEKIFNSHFTLALIDASQTTIKIPPGRYIYIYI